MQGFARVHTPGPSAPGLSASHRYLLNSVRRIQCVLTILSDLSDARVVA